MTLLPDGGLPEHFVGRTDERVALNVGAAGPGRLLDGPAFVTGDEEPGEVVVVLVAGQVG